MDECIGVGLISPPEPSDYEREQYPDDPWIRQLTGSDIVDREEKYLDEDNSWEGYIFLDSSDIFAHDPPYESRSAHHETDRCERVSELYEVRRAKGSIRKEKASDSSCEEGIWEKSTSACSL